MHNDISGNACEISRYIKCLIFSQKDMYLIPDFQRGTRWFFRAKV
jgi:predicted Ser/Thr protein kinase